MRHTGARMTTTRSRCQGWVGGGGRVGEGGHVGGRRPGDGQRMGRGGKSGRGREDGSKLPGHEQCRGGLLQTLVGLNYADPFDHFQTMLWL